MTGRPPALAPRDVLRALLRASYLIERVKGSHHILKHPDRPQVRVTLAMHRRDLKRDTLASIIKQTGLSTKESLSRL